MDYGAASRLGGSHESRGVDCFSPFLSAAGDSPMLWEFWQYALNYLIAQGNPYMGDGGGVNQGRNYGGSPLN